MTRRQVCVWLIATTALAVGMAASSSESRDEQPPAGRLSALMEAANAAGLLDYTRSENGEVFSIRQAGTEVTEHAVFILVSEEYGRVPEMVTIVESVRRLDADLTAWPVGLPEALLSMNAESPMASFAFFEDQKLLACVCRAPLRGLTPENLAFMVDAVTGTIERNSMGLPLRQPAPSGA